MKKIIALILALILCFAVAGCSVTKKDNDATVSTADEAKATDDTSVSKPVASEPVATDNAAKIYASIDEYISDPAVSKSLDSAKDSFGDKLNFDYHAEDDKLIYDYTYTEQYSEAALVSIRPTLEASFDEEADSFNQVVDVLKKTVKTASPKLVINYRNGDGTVIATHTFE